MDQKLAAYTRSQWKLSNVQTDGYTACHPFALEPQRHPHVRASSNNDRRLLPPEPSAQPAEMVTSPGSSAWTQGSLLEDQEITRPINKLMAGEKGWMRKVRLKDTGGATRGWRDSKN
jgi:hypothetical protein